MNAPSREKDDLAARLESLRRRRRKLASHRLQCCRQQELVMEQLNQRRQKRQETIDELVGLLTHRESCQDFVESAHRWNVLNDCFHIWISGSTFAVINGCRLGSEAPPVPPDLTVDRSAPTTTPLSSETTTTTILHPAKNVKDSPTTAATSLISPTPPIGGLHQNGSAQNGHSTPCLPPQQSASPSLSHLIKQGSRSFGLFTSTNRKANQNSSPAQDGSTISIATTASSPHFTQFEIPRVPWLEVNAALGYACLLLRLLQELSMTRGSGGSLKFTHTLHPMAATSKIGIRFGTNVGMIHGSSNHNHSNHSGLNDKQHLTKLKSITPVLYSLYFEESSGFNFFKNNLKNFNFALQAFLQCVAEAAAQHTDKTISLPHPIKHITDKKHWQANATNVHNFLNGGEWTIGGLSICYPSTTATVLQDGSGAAANGSHLHHHLHYENMDDYPTLQWTKACKFLLTDLKWLVVYAAKHYDR